MPVYKNSLLALATSILKHYGAKVSHESLDEMDELLKNEYKNVVVMLFDGMGENILKLHLDENGFLRSHRRSTISSVFPPTTTAATTTIESGLAPIEHAWLGWALHFDEIDKSVCIFPNTEWRKNCIAQEYHVANRFIPYKTIFERIEEETNGEIKAYKVSKFSSYATKGLDEIADIVRRLCKEDGRKYIYTYFEQPDYDMHDLGIDHPAIKEHLIKIENVVKDLANELEDTLIIITADHGHINTKWEFIGEYDDIKSCLRWLPTMEARAMSFHINEGMHEQFVCAFNKHFGKYYDLITHEEAINSGLFGDGDKNDHIEGFVGDYLAVAKADVSLEVSTRCDDLFKAAHAGATKEEYEIPFIVIDNK